MMPGGMVDIVGARASIKRLYEWKPIPSAPPVRRIEIEIVPRVSNLPKPYGYFWEGGFWDSFQANSVTKSPNRSG